MRRLLYRMKHSRDRCDQRCQLLALVRRDRKYFEPGELAQPADDLGHLGRRKEIDLVERYEREPLSEHWIECGNLAVHRSERRRRIVRRVNHVNDQPRAHDMPQKPNPESEALVRAFDQPGNIGERETLGVGNRHAADIGRERREGVGRDLRARRAERGQQRRFARIRKSHETGLRDQPQLHANPSLLARSSGGCDSRRSARRRREMHIAGAAFAALRDYRRVTGHHEVRERRAALLIEDDRAGRHSHDDVVGAVPILFLAAARLAVFRDQPRLIFEIEQRRQTLIDLEDYAAAAPAVAARGPAERPVLLAQKRDRTVAAFPGVHEYPGFIDKSHGGGITSVSALCSTLAT
jgi:hypothetical protein